MNAWQGLSKECEQAIKKCAWCAKFGHKMNDCPMYLGWIVEQERKQERLAEMQCGEVSPYRGWFWAGGLAFCAIFWGLLLSGKLTEWIYRVTR